MILGFEFLAYSSTIRVGLLSTSYAGHGWAFPFLKAET